MFSYVPEKHGFKKEDVQLIKLIATSNKFGKDKFEEDKVYLDNGEVKNFLEIMKDRSFDINIQNKLYKNIKIIEKDMPLQFEIKEEKERVILKQLNPTPLALTFENDYFLFNGNIYKPSFVQVYKYSQFYKKFMETNSSEIRYKSTDAERIISLLSFKLKDISKSLKVIQLEKAKEEDIPVKTYIDINESNKGIIVRLKFSYGNIEIDPFSDEKYANSSKVGKRDVLQERRIIELIRNLQFVHSKEGFLLSYDNTKAVVDFIKKGIEKLEKLATVSCVEDIKNVKIYEAGEYTPKVKFYHQYLEFTLDISNISFIDVVNILEAAQYDEGYHRLSNGDYVSLENNQLIKIANIIGERKIESKSTLKGWFTVLRKISVTTGRVYKRRDNLDEEILRKQAENEKFYKEKNEKLKEILMNMEKINENDFKVPEELKDVMRSYQKTGFKWFKTLAIQNLGGILADEMGLGKTLQAIALILSYIEENKENKKAAIVVAPTSLIYNWEREIEKFAPTLKTIVIYGKQKDRISLIKSIEEADVVITSYSILAKDIDYYGSTEFSYCFIDEAQQIKNPKTAAAKATKLVKAEARFALTGTSIENKLSELWAIFDFSMPGYLLSHRNFNELYEFPIMNYKDEKALESLNSIIGPFILRRLKNEVMNELPEKIEHRIIVEMTEEQRVAYFKFLSSSKESIDSEIFSKGYNRSHIHILSALTKLRQLCCHPSIVLQGYIGESAKILTLDSIIEESIAGNHRILLFSQFISVLQILKERLEDKGINCLYLDGSTKSKDRLELVDEFNRGYGEVFLISLKAGGYGLNLTGADTVIHFDPWWNPAVEDQATDRAHRIGQTKNVEVIKIITKDTIEERILKIHDRKRNIVDNVISDKNSEENFISKLSQKEIEELFQ
ncbi:DEAD/DEAH box helicase [Clostridium magnum]|uniref:RNA polymerase-associated protein RapA n=1 Tax=Clostridium magnum DSM 2767 TaxID=1121326 RepID=A0A162UNI1_9CLOT|nr:SNF2-related protein [Clostridium magnum]KZL94113.1 RNA polymerase-associated protein RapA [Clostridium magnum DSM 2767]SHH94841.1 Helicase conserved C-terminal domain-containing protein [Clostridium magnum DSM 2767]